MNNWYYLGFIWYKKNILSAFQEAALFRQDWSKEPALSCLRHNRRLNQNISPQVGLHYNNVATWRHRFLAALLTLQKFEAGDPINFGNEIQAILSDKNALVIRLFLRRTRSFESSTLPTATQLILRIQSYATPI